MQLVGNIVGQTLFLLIFKMLKLFPFATTGKLYKTFFSYLIQNIY